MTGKTQRFYEISVWNNMVGDHVKKVWRGDQGELDQLREDYDDPWYDVVIDREWDEEDDDR